MRIFISYICNIHGDEQRMMTYHWLFGKFINQNSAKVLNLSFKSAVYVYFSLLN